MTRDQRIREHAAHRYEVLLGDLTDEEAARVVRVGRAVLDAFGFSGSPAYEVETLIGAVRHVVQGPRLDALYALREALEERGEEG